MTRLHRAGMVLAGIVVTLSLGGAAPAIASSMTLPPGGGTQTPAAPHLAPAVRTVVVGGMPGWQIALIAVGAAVVAAVTAVLLDRSLAIRRRLTRVAA